MKSKTLWLVLIGAFLMQACMKKPTPQQKAAINKLIRDAYQAFKIKSAGKVMKLVDENTIKYMDKLREAALKDTKKELEKQSASKRILTKLLRKLYPSDQLKKLTGGKILQDLVARGLFADSNLVMKLSLDIVVATQEEKRTGSVKKLKLVDFAKLHLDYILMDGDSARGRPRDPWQKDSPHHWFYFKLIQGKWAMSMDRFMDRFFGLTGSEVDTLNLKDEDIVEAMYLRSKEPQEPRGKIKAFLTERIKRRWKKK